MRDDEIKNLNKLLGKLKQLKKEDRIFRDGEKKAKRPEGEKEGQSFLVSIAEIILKRLSDETGIDSSLHTPSGVKNFIADVEEFLAIFKEKGEIVAVPRNELERILDIVALAEGEARGSSHYEAVKLLKKAIDELLKS